MFCHPSLNHWSLQRWFWENHRARGKGKKFCISAPFDISVLAKNVEFKISTGRVLIFLFCFFLSLCGGKCGSSYPRFMTNSASPGVWPQPGFFAFLDLCWRYHHHSFRVLLWIQWDMMSKDDSTLTSLWVWMSHFLVRGSINSFVLQSFTEHPWGYQDEAPAFRSLET